METEKARQFLGRHAAELIADHYSIGLGTGSTAEQFIIALSARVARGLKVKVFASSEKSAQLAHDLKLNSQPLAMATQLDIVVDSADQIGPSGEMIKGGGGALFREKLMAHLTRRYVILADWKKFASPFGQFPLPLEIAPFAWHYLENTLRCFGEPKLRKREGKEIMSDNGNLLIDLKLSSYPRDWIKFNGQLKLLCGVIETGLFLEMKPEVFKATQEGGIEIWRPSPTDN